MTLIRIAALCAAMVWAMPAAAQDAPPKREALRVCQDPNNLPFSNSSAQGIEILIAAWSLVMEPSALK